MMAQTTNNRPNIYEYLDYRHFVRDMYEYRKQIVPGFSYRTFSRVAGFRSSNFLKLIMDGKRNLSNEGIIKFAKALKLNKGETNFFETLVHFSQTKGADEKNRHYEQIAKTRSYNGVKQLESFQYAYFSNWYYVALRELVNLKSFREDPEWINRKLQTKLSHDEIKKVLQTLIDLKLLKRDQYKRLEPTETKITTTPEIANLSVLNFHKEMMKKASDSLEQSKTKHRDISGLTISLSKNQYEKIQERVNQFRREIHAIASEEKDPEAVYQVNFQLFNLSEVPWK